MKASPILLQKKYARIVALFAKNLGISLDDALEFFYQSALYDLVSNGISDMHCRSDLYLVEELKLEYERTFPRVKG